MLYRELINFISKKNANDEVNKEELLKFLKSSVLNDYSVDIIWDGNVIDTLKLGELCSELSCDLERIINHIEDKSEDEISDLIYDELFSDITYKYMDINVSK